MVQLGQFTENDLNVKWDNNEIGQSGIVTFEPNLSKDLSNWGPTLTGWSTAELVTCGETKHLFYNQIDPSLLLKCWKRIILFYTRLELTYF